MRRKLLPVIALSLSLAPVAAPAHADIGWVEIDVAGTAPNRVVTYQDLSSIRLLHDTSRANLLAAAPADSNTAALSRTLAETSRWRFGVYRVFEGNQPVVELRQVHYSNMTVDCSSGVLFTINTEVIRKANEPDLPPHKRREDFQVQDVNRSLPGDERWQQVARRNACDQQFWRAALPTRKCLDYKLQPLGMECVGVPDHDYLRMMAGYAMSDPAQAKAIR